MSFDEFGLDPRCLRVLKMQDIVDPTPIQIQAIPLVLEEKDIIATAQTGTGKTLAFALPAVTRLAQSKLENESMLVLLPTRELCQQVYDVISELGAAMGIRCVEVYGGTSIDRQTQELRKGVHVIVATPGRLIDHLHRKNIHLRNVRILVLDEADRMLDMGFFPDINYIVGKLPADRQTLMFSATFPNEIARLAERMQRDPERVQVGKVAKPVDTVRQRLYPVRQEDKSALLCQIMDDENVAPALIFLRTKSRTERLAHTLRKKRFRIAQMHGDRSQSQREQALDGFRDGKYDILVATDVAARGLDVDGISHVINYDIPLSADDYIHRIGRTARAHSEGDAITFVCPTEHKALESIERILGHNIDQVEWENAPRILTLFHPPGSPEARVQRRRRGGMAGGRRRR